MKVIKIDNCHDCPAYNQTRREDYCRLGEVPLDIIENPETPPEWCPVMKQPVVIRSSKPYVFITDG